MSRPIEEIERELLDIQSVCLAVLNAAEMTRMADRAAVLRRELTQAREEANRGEKR